MKVLEKASDAAATEVMQAALRACRRLDVAGRGRAEYSRCSEWYSIAQSIEYRV